MLLARHAITCCFAYSRDKRYRLPKGDTNVVMDDISVLGWQQPLAGLCHSTRITLAQQENASMQAFAKALAARIWYTQLTQTRSRKLETHGEEIHAWVI